MMGSKFAIITSKEQFIPAMEEHISMYGVESKAIKRNPVRALTIPEKEIFKAFGGGWDLVIKDIQKAAIGCIEDGADVLIVGCGLVSPMMTQAGITEIAGAAVVDPLIASLKFAEALVDMNKAKIPTVSRKAAFSAVSQRELIVYHRIQS